MKIIVDGTPLLRVHTGVSRYTKQLLEALLRLDHKNNYEIVGFASVKEPVKGFPLLPRANLRFKRIRFMPIEVYQRLLRKLGFAPPLDLMLGASPDWWLFPNFVRLPLIRKKKSIVVVYDLSFVKFAEFTSPGNREYLQRWVPKSITSSTVVVTISENSKREIVEQYGTNPDKIHVLYPAIDQKLFKESPQQIIDSTLARHKIGKDYILYSGTLEPRKNIISVLTAYEKLPQKLRDQYGLVLMGGRGWLDEQINQHITQLQNNNFNIKLTGYVPDSDLAPIYSGAKLLVYPPFYEGFGLPPLEAMACGTPVVTSNNSSLPEVVGDAGIMVDAKDTKALAEAIEKVISDPTLAAEMRSKGFIQAQKYSWETSAKKLLAIFEG